MAAAIEQIRGRYKALIDRAVYERGDSVLAMHLVLRGSREVRWEREYEQAQLDYLHAECELDWSVQPAHAQF